jgi:hypothetical protein
MKNLRKELRPLRKLPLMMAQNTEAIETMKATADKTRAKAKKARKVLRAAIPQ